MWTQTRRIHDTRQCRIAIGCCCTQRRSKLMDGSAIALKAEIVAGVDVGHYSARFIPSLEFLYFPEQSSFIHWTYGIESLSLENVFHVTPLYALSLAPSVSYIFAASTAPPCYDVCYSAPYVMELLVGGSFSPLLLAFGPKRSFELGAYARVEVGVKDGIPYLGGYLAFRWFFAMRRGDDPASNR
jgi:hypothetical protein